MSNLKAFNINYSCLYCKHVNKPDAYTHNFLLSCSLGHKTYLTRKTITIRELTYRCPDYKEK